MCGNIMTVEGDLDAVFDDSVCLIVAVHVSCDRNISSEDLNSIVERNMSMMFAHNRECSLLGAQMYDGIMEAEVEACLCNLHSVMQM